MESDEETPKKKAKLDIDEVDSKYFLILFL